MPPDRPMMMKLLPDSAAAAKLLSEVAAAANPLLLAKFRHLCDLEKPERTLAKPVQPLPDLAKMKAVNSLAGVVDYGSPPSNPCGLSWMK